MRGGPRAVSWAAAGSIYVAAFAAQTWNLGRTVRPALDEGVYLYAARLLTQGWLPYRDFFMSHPPYTLLGAAAGLALTGFDVPVFSTLYVAWVLSAVFPLFFAVEEATTSRPAAVLSALLFVTFPEFALWDARFFAVRQASLPFLAFGLLLLVRRRRPALAGVLLGLFALGVVAHAALALLVLAGVVAGELRASRRPLREIVRENRRLLGAFLLTTAAGYGLLFAVPNGASNLLGYQFDRPAFPVLRRLESFARDVLPLNAALLASGVAGSFLLRARGGGIGLANLAGLPLFVLGFRSFYPHYLSSFAVTLAFCGGLLVARASRPPAGRWLAPSLLCVLLGATAVPRLAEDLIRYRTPGFFRVVEALCRTRDPLFAFEPIYALYAGRELTPHYHVADMRAFRTMERGVPDELWNDLYRRSRTILVEPFFASRMTPARWRVLESECDLVFSDRWHRIYVKKEGGRPVPDSRALPPAGGPPRAVGAPPPS